MNLLFSWSGNIVDFIDDVKIFLALVNYSNYLFLNQVEIISIFIWKPITKSRLTQSSIESIYLEIRQIITIISIIDLRGKAQQN